MSDTPTINGLSEMRCKGCNELLRVIELEYMTAHNLDRCVKCRAKEQQKTVVIPKSKYGYKSKR